MQTSLVQKSSTRHEKSQAAAGKVAAPAIMFIDSAVDDLATLIDGVQPGVKVVTLDPSRDGVGQITKVLRTQPDIGAVHIVSHGAPGCLYLGNIALSLETLSRYAQELADWREHCGAASLLLYGCNLAAGDAGTEFLEQLHQITNLPIAASRAKIGNSVLGSNWQLEVAVGLQRLTQPLPFTPKIQSLYTGIFAGAQLLRDIRPGDSSYPSSLTEFNGQLFFSANDGATGRELWVSDGTTEGTQLLKDIWLGSLPSGFAASSYPFNLTEVNGQLFFTANDGTAGNELWVSDGTTEGTQLLKDIRLGSESSSPGLGQNRYNFDFDYSSFTEFNGKLFFAADDGTTGRELWVSDGTAEGTQLLKDIFSGSLPSGITASSRPFNLTEVNGKLFFTANDGTTGRELWVSDGTAEGTQLLKDIRLGSDGSYPGLEDPNRSSTYSSFTEVNGKLFFIADDGVTGEELWVSDGTAEGTQLLKDIWPEGGGSYASNFTEIDGKLFFSAVNDSVTGIELWVSDGTAEGTQLLKDIRPEGGGSYPYNFTEFNGKLFFTANDNVTGIELWVSDGTAEGTQLLKDINDSRQPLSGPSSYISRFTEVDGKLFFTANDGRTGRELWVSDGTAEGTQLFQDINPDIGFGPGNLKAVGNQLFFTVDDGKMGNELWVTSIPKEIISGDENNNVLNGTDEFDLINGLGGNDVIRGRSGDDIIRGSDGNDALFGDRGNDLLEGGVGNDQIFGDVGNDTVIVYDFKDLDTFDGGTGIDLIRFEPTDGRNLTIFLDRGAVGDGQVGGQFFENFEQFATGRGNDRLLGDARANVFDGGAGNDELQGAAGRDNLTGGEGNDTLIGGHGADTLTGGEGNDILTGEGGADTFRFSESTSFADRTDTIFDFQTQDTFDFTVHLSAGGSIETTRVASGFLRLDLLVGEDTVVNVVNVFGSKGGLDAAESQLATILASPLT
jgi:ELWxxDGT repeat protein